MYRVTCEGCASCRFAAIGEMEIECWAAIGKSKESFDCAQDKPARMPFATTLRTNRRYEMRRRRMESAGGVTAGAARCAPTKAIPVAGLVTMARTLDYS